MAQSKPSLQTSSAKSMRTAVRRAYTSGSSSDNLALSSHPVSSPSYAAVWTCTDVLGYPRLRYHLEHVHLVAVALRRNIRWVVDEGESMRADERSYERWTWRMNVVLGPSDPLSGCDAGVGRAVYGDAERSNRRRRWTSTPRVDDGWESALSWLSSRFLFLIDTLSRKSMLSTSESILSFERLRASRKTARDTLTS